MTKKTVHRVINGDSLFDGDRQNINLIQRSISYLFAHYFIKLEDNIKNFFDNYIYSWSDFSIAIYSKDITCKTAELSFLTNEIHDLNEKNPIKIIITRTQDEKNYIRAFVVINMHYINTIFDGNTNKGEKYILKLLIANMFDFFKIGKEYEEINNLLNKIIPEAPKSFDIQPVTIYNPKLIDYPKFQDIHEHDISNIYIEICRLLNESDYESGSYERENATNIIYYIFDFLLNYLFEKLKDFKKSILLKFIYKEIEIIEGNREKNKLQSSIDATNPNIEFDLLKEEIQSSKNISKAAITAKYLFTIIYSKEDNFFGSKTMTNQDWQLIFTIADNLNFFANLSDLIYYDLAEISFNILDSYDYTVKIINNTLDMDSFHESNTQNTLFNLKENFMNSISEHEFYSYSENEYGMKQFESININFEKFLNFKFSNLLLVLFVLGTNKDFSSNYFPLLELHKKDLINEITKNIVEPIDSLEVERILEFLAFKQLPSNLVIPSKIIKNKGRINLFPLVNIDRDYFIFGHQLCLKSFEIWHYYLSSATFPLDSYENESYKNIEEYFKKYHKELDKQLENEVCEIAKNILGKESIECRLEKYKRLSVNSKDKIECGEIDLLAINKDLKIIFVIDAKNINRSITIAEINRELKYFFTNTKGYYYHLNQKYEFITNNKDIILQHFNVTNKTDWSIKKAFVLQEIYPSAFSKYSKNVDFVLISDLEKNLKNP